MANFKVYIVASCEYSREGIEGIVGYSPHTAHLSHEKAKNAIEQDVKQRYQDREGLELIWETPRDNDSHDLVLHVFYLSHSTIPKDKQLITPSGLLVQHYGIAQKSRQDTYEEWSILEIEVNNG